MTTDARIHSLDAVRAFALLCGIALHCTMSFSPAFTRVGLPISDVSQSLTLQALFHVLHSFRMLLFFLIAGFFARLLLMRDGTRAFWTNRLKRIAAPLVIGWIILMPLIIATFVWAVMTKHGGPPAGSKPSAAMAGGGIPLAHLWFLYYLLLLYLIALTCRWAVHRIDRRAHLPRWADACVQWLVRKQTAVIVLPIPLIASLYFDPDWIPWTGIPTPLRGFTPHHTTIAAFGTAFAFGWLLHRQQELLRVWSRHWPAHCIAASAASVVSISIVGLTGDPSTVTSELERLTYAAVYVFAAWNWVLAITGIGVRFMFAPSTVWRYLSDSSYWMYLVHLPLVYALQVAMMKWPLHWSIKFPLILGIAFVLLLWSYRVLVRNTFIGQWLNGRRYP